MTVPGQHRRSLPRRIAEEALGGPEATEGVWPLMLVVAVGTGASSAFYGYAGVWAIKELGASPGQVGVMFVFDASFAAIAGYLGGGISDRVGRRTVMVVSFALQALAIAACAVAGHHKLVGLLLI